MKKQDNERTMSIGSTQPKLEYDKYLALLPASNDEAYRNEILELLWDIAGTLSRLRYSMEPIQNLFSQSLKNTWTEAQSTVRLNDPANDVQISDEKESL